MHPFYALSDFLLFLPCREMGGIQPLVGLLGNPMVKIHRAACGSLRNLSFGKMHEENKVKIKANGGIPALARLVRTSTDAEVRRK